MRTIIAIGVALLLGSAAPAGEILYPAEPVAIDVPQPAADDWRSIMIYTESDGDLEDGLFPLRDEPYIVTLPEVDLYRKGIRACDTVIEICRPRENGTFLNPAHLDPGRRATAAERRKYCGPLEPANQKACIVPQRGSF